MDTRQFITSLVSSAAWPVAVVIIGLVYREAIVRWITERRAPDPPTTPDTSVPFAEVLAQTTQQLVEAAIVRPAGATQQDLHRDDVDRTINPSPAAAVVEMHALIDKALQRLVYGGPSNDAKDLGTVTMSLARSARNSGHVNDNMVEAIEKLTLLRGLATNRGGGEVDQMGSLGYTMLVQAVLYQLEHSNSE